MKIRQPKTLKCDGTSYRLVTRHTIISKEPPISVGPLYRKADSEATYMPDLAFLLGHTKTPEVMFRVG